MFEKWDGKTERRKANRMNGHFQPSNAFEGFVAAKLENLEKKFDNLPCEDNFKRLNKCETDVAKIKGQSSVFGAVFGFIAGLISKIFLK